MFPSKISVLIFNKTNFYYHSNSATNYSSIKDEQCFKLTGNNIILFHGTCGTECEHKLSFLILQLIMHPGNCYIN